MLVLKFEVPTATILADPAGRAMCVVVITLCLLSASTFSSFTLKPMDRFQPDFEV